jgi:adenosylcobyric acid synthase
MRVAPFKAQNMSLNSFVTAAGDEIGRAQVVQAEAAGIAPTVEMNPVLLKPESDNHAQIIVRGKPLTRISAAHFPQLKAELWSAITESIDQLRQVYDVVVIEGAGSPAEINLKDRDLVNMKVALYCNSRVARGRYRPWRNLCGAGGNHGTARSEGEGAGQGVHRQQISRRCLITQAGLEWLEARTGVPVAGVVPYYHDIHIAEEDSIALEKRQAMKNRQDFDLDIAVIALPSHRQL